MKICYSYYVLDIVHQGHINHMMNAKALAGKDGVSVVGILTKEAVLEKKPKKPILSFDERMMLARSIQYNDYVVPQKDYSPLKNINNIRPDFVMESTSHSKDDIDEVRKFVEKYGGRVIVNPYFPYRSSTSIKQKINEKQK